jgi:hypothetical protein
MASLNIREVDEALVKELKVGAAQAGLTLKQYVLRKLGGDGLEKKVAEESQSSVGAKSRKARYPIRSGERKARVGGLRNRETDSPAAMPVAPKPQRKGPDPDFKKKCSLEYCRHEKVYHTGGMCQLCDGPRVTHEFQE